MRRLFALIVVLLLVACDAFVNAPSPTPTPSMFMPTSTLAPTKTPLIIPTVQVSGVHFNANVRGDIPVLNVRDSTGTIVSDRKMGYRVLVVSRAETLSGLTVEVASEGEFEGWWCQIDSIDSDLWVACDLLNGSRFDFDD